MERRYITLVMELSFFLTLLTGIILGLVLGRGALSLIERISLDTPLLMDMHLSMSYSSMGFFSLCMVTVTGISVFMENRKRNKKPLWEVIHVK